MRSDDDVLMRSVFVVQLWVQERMPTATSTDHGHNLQTVQLLIKKNQVKEVTNYRFTLYIAAIM